VPAAAVIPAPVAYIKAVAVKKLVVEPRGHAGMVGSFAVCTGLLVPTFWMLAAGLN